MKAINVLYVEDEPFLAQIVCESLETSGYKVVHVTDGGLALQSYIKHKPDICILDIMLPMKDGYTLSKEIRSVNAEVPIIFLSAKNLAEDVIRGFKSGGNDYLKKPFSIEELLVRVESLLSRFKKLDGEPFIPRQVIYHFGNCSLDPTQQLLKTTHAEYNLSFKETCLLEIMLSCKNQLIERETMLLKIWGDNSYYNTRSMDVFLTHLRKLLKDDGQIQLINIRGIGYKLIIKE